MAEFLLGHCSRHPVMVQQLAASFQDMLDNGMVVTISEGGREIGYVSRLVPEGDVLSIYGDVIEGASVAGKSVKATLAENFLDMRGRWLEGPRIIRVEVSPSPAAFQNTASGL